MKRDLVSRYLNTSRGLGRRSRRVTFHFLKKKADVKGHISLLLFIKRQGKLSYAELGLGISEIKFTIILTNVH